jgi:hypothetical protein
VPLGLPVSAFQKIGDSNAENAEDAEGRIGNNDKAISIIGSPNMLFAVPQDVLFSACSALSALR